jgi:type II secretory pathway component PulK
MRQCRMPNKMKNSEKGVALIAAMLLLILMSALAVALLYKVNYEHRHR